MSLPENGVLATQVAKQASYLPASLPEEAALPNEAPTEEAKPVVDAAQVAGLEVHYYGVFYDKIRATKKWRMTITCYGVAFQDNHDDPIEAARQHDKLAKDLFQDRPKLIRLNNV